MRRNTPRKTPAEQQAILSQFSKSGLTAAEFCRKKSINYAAFCKWRSAAKPLAQQSPQTEPHFISLAPFIPQAEGRCWNIVLQLAPGVEIRLSQTA